MGNELLATFYILRKKYNVYGCWDKETPEQQFDFYDIYEDDGKTQEHLNTGEPFWEFPSWSEIFDFINQ